MSRDKGLLRGSKFGGRHTTMTDPAKNVYRVLKAMPEVEKIVIGIITQCRGGASRVKATPLPAAVKIQVRGANSVQLLYAYTSNTSAVISRLSQGVL